MYAITTSLFWKAPLILVIRHLKAWRIKHFSNYSSFASDSDIVLSEIEDKTVFILSKSI